MCIGEYIIYTIKTKSIIRKNRNIYELLNTGIFICVWRVCMMREKDREKSQKICQCIKCNIPIKYKREENSCFNPIRRVRRRIKAKFHIGKCRLTLYYKLYIYIYIHFFTIFLFKNALPKHRRISVYYYSYIISTVFYGIIGIILHNKCTVFNERRQEIKKKSYCTIIKYTSTISYRIL